MFINSFLLSALSLVVLQVGDTNATTVSKCIQTLKPRLGPPANPALEYRVREERMQVGRFRAVERLSELGEDAAPALPILSQLVFDRLESKKFKLLAIKAIGSIGATENSSLPTLNKLLQSSEPELKLAALEAIDHINSFPRLMADLSSPDLGTKLNAAEALSDFGSASFSGLLNVYLDESSNGKLRDIALQSMRQATRRFDFAAAEVERLLAHSDDEHFRLGLDLLFHLPSNPKGHSQGMQVLNGSSKFEGPTLVKSLFFSDRLKEGPHIGLKAIPLLEKGRGEIANAVASDSERFELAVRMQAARIVLQEVCSNSKFSVNGRALRQQMSPHFLDSLDDGANRETIAALILGLTESTSTNSSEMRNQYFSKALARQRNSISLAEDYSFPLLIDAYIKSIANDESRSLLQLSIQNFLATRTTSKKLLLDLLVSDSIEYSSLAQRMIFQREDRYGLTTADLEKVPRLIMEELLVTPGTKAILSPECSYFAVWTPAEIVGFLGRPTLPDHEVRVYRVGTDEPIVTGGHTHIAPAFSRDGRYLAITSQESTSIWDLKLKQVHLKLPVARATSVSFLDGGRLIQCSTFEFMSWGHPQDRYMKFWDTKTGIQVNSDKLPLLVPAAMSEHGAMLAGFPISDEKHQDLIVWNIRTGGELARIKLPDGDTNNFSNYACLFSEDGNTLQIFRYQRSGDASPVVDRTIVFDLTSQRVVKDISLPADRKVIGLYFQRREDRPFVNRNPYSPGYIYGSPFPICVNSDQSIELWDLWEGNVVRRVDGKAVDPVLSTKDESLNETLVGWIGDGNHVFFRKGMKSVLLNAKDEEVENYFGQEIDVYAPALNGSDAFWAWKTDDSVAFADAQTGQTIRRIKIGRTREISLSKNGDLVAVMQNNLVRLWRVRDKVDLLRQ